MKLYYSPGACSLNPHIALYESGLPFEIERADIRAKKTAGGGDFLAVNPKGQVPTLVLDDGQVLTENAAIVQYIADRANGADLAPPPGTMERYRLQEWLSFVSEIHKGYANLFNPNAPAEMKDAARARIVSRIAIVDQALADGRDYLLGRFSVADIFAFVIIGWTKRFDIDIGHLAHVARFMERMRARPAVQKAMAAEAA